MNKVNHIKNHEKNNNKNQSITTNRVGGGSRKKYTQTKQTSDLKQRFMVAQMINLSEGWDNAKNQWGTI